MFGMEARNADRYLISMSKCLAELETDDGQTASGYLTDISATGCMFVTQAGQLKLFRQHSVSIVTDGHRMPGSAVRTNVYGLRVHIGIQLDDVPETLLDRIKRIGGALRFNRGKISIVNILTMPVATKAMKLMQTPEVSTIDLANCDGMEFAGAGFLAIAADRGKAIVNVGGGIAKLVELAGITLRTEPVAA